MFSSSSTSVASTSWPARDRGIRRGVQLAYNLKGIATTGQVQEKAELWRPYRSIASVYLWTAVKLGLSAADLKDPASKRSKHRQSAAGEYEMHTPLREALAALYSRYDADQLMERYSAAAKLVADEERRRVRTRPWILPMQALSDTARWRDRICQCRI
jgi:hypothetical protein